MKKARREDLSQFSMLELFRVESETQTAILTAGLLDLERGNRTPQLMEMLMRAAHSLKGAARIVNLQLAVQVAHALEDCFVGIQQDKLALRQPALEVMFRGLDLLSQVCKCPESDIVGWENDHAEEISQFQAAVSRVMAGTKSGVGGEGRVLESRKSRSPTQQTGSEGSEKSSPLEQSSLAPAHPAIASRPSHPPERVVRLAAENLNRLLALAGESLVESRWLRPFAESLQRLKRHHSELAQALESLRNELQQGAFSEQAQGQFNELLAQVGECQHFLDGRIEELERFDRRSAQHSHRLYLEVLRTRMRPFAEGARRFPRMVRDLAHSLDKEVRLEITGENTQVDRDILERLETPLSHLLRNAVDHGCEPPDERLAAGKPREGLIRLDARHSAGMLLVTVSDDGPGIEAERVRAAIVERKLATRAAAQKLPEAELLEFLFLPGFSLRATVTEISGRGVGLDIVQNMVKGLRGAVRVSSQPGRGLRLQLQLPLTLSVLRTLLVEVAGEPYAFPLGQINRTLKLHRDQIQFLEGRPYFQCADQQLGLLSAHQVLDCAQIKPAGPDLAVVVIGDRAARYGVIVDGFLGERELVVQPLDSRLGKVTDISAAALMEDGSPILVLDVEEMLVSIDKLLAGGRLGSLAWDALAFAPGKQKRVLAVDDSLSVRELQRKLLSGRGYLIDVAVDGMDGWNAVRSRKYDLVVTDVDMPRMDGIELAALIKKDPRLKSMPVMIVSYKDSDEARMRGLEAGADYYLSKGNFHEEALLQAVVDLIGEPDE